MTRTIWTLIFILIFGCNSKDSPSSSSIAQDSLRIKERDEEIKCPLDNKVYEYLYDTDVPSHLFTLVFKCRDNGLTGKLFGPDPEGEHGLWFFKADLKNLKVDSLNNIEFEFAQGYLYPDRITIDNYLDTLSTDNAGISKGLIFYKGKISGDSIVFKCTSEYNDCYDQAMTFRTKN